MKPIACFLTHLDCERSVGYASELIAEKFKYLLEVTAYPVDPLGVYQFLPRMADPLEKEYREVCG